MGSSSSKHDEDEGSGEGINFRKKIGWINEKRKYIFQSSSPVNGLSQDEYAIEGGQRKRHNPSNFRSERQAISFRSTGSMDSSRGLQCLLSPVNATPSRRFVLLSGADGDGSKPGQTLDYMNSEMQGGDPMDLSNPSVGSEGEGLVDTDEEELLDGPIPTFDPFILATFEQAIDDFSGNDGWGHYTSPGDAGMNNSGQLVDHVDNHRSNELASIGANITFMEKDAYRQLDEPTMMAENYNFVETCNDLDCFEMKCPLGCEDKIVLYFTSLRGVRKTYEDCATVRLILKGYGLLVDERDVWMHSKFREELASVLEPGGSVPQLFVKGRHIGGAEVVKHLHEGGALGNLVEGLPRDYSTMCNICGGVRFIPCISCNGSRKRVTVDAEILLCPDCNENGLILCPSCGS